MNITQLKIIENQSIIDNNLHYIYQDYYYNKLINLISQISKLIILKSITFNKLKRIPTPTINHSLQRNDNRSNSSFIIRKQSLDFHRIKLNVNFLRNLGLNQKEMIYYWNMIQDIIQLVFYLLQNLQRNRNVGI
ncbi:unnamed protein product [Paramecium pentaurelia]|uniref:Uncharacterized protein n=1 Tax=Paramecium pentaurelia TaxID=43138 RepID=A0A8S1TAK2_9CILI|nr:unnamed protein product [Paramecium pentaurelia]